MRGDVIVVDGISGLLAWRAQPVPSEPQSPQFAELLAIGDEWADDGHCPSDAVDCHHFPQWQVDALRIKEPLQPTVIEQTAEQPFSLLGTDRYHHPQLIEAEARSESLQEAVQLER